MIRALQTTCPWPCLKVPPGYVSAGKLLNHVIDGWELDSNNQLPIMVRGYYTGLHLTPRWMHNMPVLKKDGQIWMSITPMELESQASMLHHAKGKVLVAGVGMGVLLWNIARKSTVSEVIAVDLDENILDLISRLTKGRGWGPVREKVTLVHADARVYQPCIEPDFLAADIWPLLGDDDALPDMHKICSASRPKECLWWGVEFDFVHWCMGQKMDANSICNLQTWQKFVDGVNLPIVRDDPHIPRLSKAAIINQMLS